MPDTMMNEQPTSSGPPPLCFTRSPEFKNFIAAFVKMQAALQGAKKDAKNEHFKSSYADLESVWQAARKPLADNGLAVMQWPRTINNGIELETFVMHVSGEWASGILELPAKMDAQGIGSALTYARRYGLMAALGIAPEEDDGNAAADRSGVPGSAGGGKDFRPATRRMVPSNYVEAARQDGTLDETRAKGTLPVKNGNANAAPAASAIKRVEWVKAAIDGFKGQTKDGLQTWWKSERERLEVIEGAMPAEYERLLAAYDAAFDNARA